MTDPQSDRASDDQPHPSLGAAGKGAEGKQQQMKAFLDDSVEAAKREDTRREKREEKHKEQRQGEATRARVEVDAEVEQLAEQKEETAEWRKQRQVHLQEIERDKAKRKRDSEIIEEKKRKLEAAREKNKKSMDEFHAVAAKKARASKARTQKLSEIDQDFSTVRRLSHEADLSTDREAYRKKEEVERELLAKKEAIRRDITHERDALYREKSQKAAGLEAEFRSSLTRIPTGADSATRKRDADVIHQRKVLELEKFYEQKANALQLTERQRFQDAERAATKEKTDIETSTRAEHTANTQKLQDEEARLYRDKRKQG